MLLNQDQANLLSMLMGTDAFSGTPGGAVGAAESSADGGAVSETGGGTAAEGGSGTGAEGAGESGAQTEGAGESGAQAAGADESGAQAAGADESGAQAAGADESGAQATGAGESGGQSSGAAEGGGQASGAAESGGQASGAAESGGQSSGASESGGQASGATESGGADPVPSGGGSQPQQGGAAALTSTLVEVADDSGSGVLFFAGDSADLTDSARKVLDTCAERCQAAACDVELVGFASLEGDASHNSKLAAARARAAKDYLAARGLPEGSIGIGGGGPTDSFSKSDAAPNRRATLDWTLMQVLPSGGDDPAVPAAQVRRTPTSGSASLFFAKDSAALTGSDRAALELCVQDCLAPGTTLQQDCVVAIGMASLDGDAGHNQQLSDQRAFAARDYLVAHGVAAQFILAMGEGGTDQYSSTDLAQNRRMLLAWVTQPVQPSPPDQPGGGKDVPDPTPVDDRAALTSTLGSSDANGGTAHIFFATASAELTGSARQVLDAVAGQCQAAGQFGLTSLGSADLDGDAGDNDTLAAQRAQAVEDYLVSKGLPEDLVFVNSIGGVDRYSKTERAQNRRAELSWRLMHQAPGGGGDGGARPSAFQTSDEGGFAQLYFAAGKVELTPSARSALDQCVADCVAPGATLQEGTVVVKAFASLAGDAGRDPGQLAEDRGDVVKDYLAQRAVDGKAINVASTATDHFSKKDPAANQVVTVRWTPRGLPPSGVVTPPPGKQAPQDLSLAFASGKTDLPATARSQIDGLGDLSGASAIRVDSYSSKDGDAKRNLQLSLERARAVADYLITKGASASVIQSSGHGGTDQFSKKDPGANRVTLVHVEF